MDEQNQPDPRDNDRTERFVTLLATAEPRVHSYILTLLPNWADAEEVLQQANIALWRKFDEFEEGTNFVAWARSIAHFEVLRFRQKRGRDRLVFSEALMERLDQTVADQSDRLAAETDALAGCLAKLPPDDRDLVHRCYSGDEKLNTIADELGTTGNALYKKLGRLRRALLTCVTAALKHEGWS